MSAPSEMFRAAAEDAIREARLDRLRRDGCPRCGSWDVDEALGFMVGICQECWYTWTICREDLPL